MAEIGFYHLTRTGLERALPRLLARTLEAKERAFVLCGEAERIGAVSAALWGAEAAWLPHNAGPDDDPPLQPIWLGVEDAPPPNGARYLFLVAGAESGRLDAFARVFDLFDGRDEAAVAAARQRWTAAKAAGHALTYWKQTERGGWEKAG
ncbi:MAG TPA: DNA polymerase III subunit chi [Acetobacteraceae bacterium]|nr:DNA polymerase III subunit chi [Acetobacteraceae bacterium]